MNKRFCYPPHIRKITVGGMLGGSIVSLFGALLSIYIDTFYVLSLFCMVMATFFLILYYSFRISMSDIQINESGIWNLFRGKKRNYCRWSDLTRAINRPDWSLALQGKTELWMLFATSEGRKAKLTFDNNIEGYAELARFVEQQVKRHGIKIEGR